MPGVTANSASRSRSSRSSDTLGDAEPLTNSSARTTTGVSAQDNGTRTLSISHRSLSANSMNNEIEKISRKYEIKRGLAECLLQLRGYEIVIVCDDSGSMSTPIDNTQRTRWDELRDIVKIILEISVIFDSNGVDIYFLNRDPILKVKDPKKIDKEFEIPPCGFTPLVPVLKSIFESNLANERRDKKLLVFVATDGLPTDDDGETNINELEHLMNVTRRIKRTFVSFLLCTDDPECVECLNEWDHTMENVDVTDDFHTEREKIRRARKLNRPFSKGDYVVKALLGAVDPTIDAWND